jgi:hypothetical protein
MRESCDVWEFGVLEGTCGLASSWSFAVFLVGCNVEKYKEDEVGGDRNNAGKSSELFARAFAHVGHPREVRRGKVCVGREIDEAWRNRWLRPDFVGIRYQNAHTDINNKLNDLKASNPFLPPDPDTTRALEVVPVHEDVNREI